MSGNSANPAFEFATATRIIFGEGKLAEAPETIKGFGQKVLVVTGRHPKRAAPLLDLLKAFDCAVHCIPGEPTLSDITEGVRAAAGREVVVAIGGGSAIDAGKAIAALTTNPGNRWITWKSSAAANRSPRRPAVYRHPDHRRHGRGGHAQCRDHLPRSTRKSEPASSAHVTRRGDC